MKDFVVTTVCQSHVKLFRTYVSKNAAGKARAVLEGVGLDASTIAACFRANPKNDEETVQEGLTRWCGGKGTQPPTWGILIGAMVYAEIAQQHIQDLKDELDCYGTYMLFALVCRVHVCVCVCVCCVQTCLRHEALA